VRHGVLLDAIFQQPPSQSQQFTTNLPLHLTGSACYRLRFTSVPQNSVAAPALEQQRHLSHA